jgi:acyl-CoA thioester hydrolase
MFLVHISPRVYETDAFGHINNTVVPGWFEKGREPLFRIFTPDLNIRTMPLIIARIEVDFLAELHHGADVEVRSWIRKIGNSSMEVVQEAWQNGVCGARGVCVMLHFDYAVKKAVSVPEGIRGQLQEHFLGK